MTTESPELKALLKSLEHPQLKTIDLSLARVERHLAAIGNPQRMLPPVVHVAGTNGKGSTIAFLRAMMEAAGYRCHVFTSPHLVHFRERIVVAGDMLDEAALMDVLTRVKQRMQAYPLTFFEANTVAAFELFAAHEADVVLFEVGMGGRFDATNAIDAPLLSVITPVSMDHQEFLGDTLAKIAFEKAGIIKPGVPVVVAPQAEEAMQVIEAVAREQKSPLFLAQSVDAASVLALSGAHQHMNASAASAAASILYNNGFSRLDDAAVRNGLAQAYWPGRLQRLSDGPLIDALPEGVECRVDGGHNASAGAQLAEWAAQQSQPVHLICAMSGRKDAAGFLAPLARVCVRITVTTIPGEPLAMPVAELFQAASAIHSTVNIAEMPEEAASDVAEGSVALFAGSLYFCGYILEKNG